MYTNRQDEHWRGAPSVPAPGAPDPAPEFVHTVVEALDRRGGGILTTDPRQFSVGEGLRVDLRLPNGEGMRLLGVVREIQRVAGSRAQRVILNFEFHQDNDRLQLDAYVSCPRSTKFTPIRARVAEKFDLRQTRDRLSISLSGALSPGEAKVLCERVESTLAPTPFAHEAPRPLLISIDATRFSACPEPALEWMRRWLSLLASRGPMLGVLIGPNTVGMMQLHRLVRAVELAENLMLCSSHEDAEATLVALGHELFGGQQ